MNAEECSAKSSCTVTCAFVFRGKHVAFAAKPAEGLPHVWLSARFGLVMDMVELGMQERLFSEQALCPA